MVFCYRNFRKLIPSLTSSVSHTMIPDSDHIPFKTTSNSIHCPQRQLSCSCHEMQCTWFGVHTRACACVWVCVPSCFSCVWLFATPWIIAHQALLSMGFSRQDHWSRLPCLPPRDLPNPGIQPVSLMSPVLEGRFFTSSTTWEDPFSQHTQIKNICIPFNCILFTLKRRSSVVCDIPLHRLCWLGGIFPYYATRFQLKALHCFAPKPFITSVAQARLQNLDGWMRQEQSWVEECIFSPKQVFPVIKNFCGNDIK